MSWIDEGLNRKKTADASRDKISANAQNLYETLWKEISRCMNEAKSKGIPTFADHQPGPTSYDRGVGLPGPPRHGQSSSHAKMLRVILSDDKHTIEITGDSKPLTLELDLCNDEPCLKHDGKTVSIPEAAQLILEPFFFAA